MSTCIFINSIFTNNFCEVMHGEEIWVVPAWSQKCSTNRSVWNFIISLEHQGWCKIWLLFVWNLTFYWWSDTTEMLVDKFVELSWFDFSCTWHNDILSNEKLIVELFHLISSNWVSIFSDTSAWLSQIMISESSVMNHLKSIFVWIHVGSILINGRFQSFNLNWFISWL